MHATDGSAAEDTTDRDSPPGNTIIGSDGEESGEEDDDRDKEGYGSEAT